MPAQVVKLKIINLDFFSCLHGFDALIRGDHLLNKFVSYTISIPIFVGLQHFHYQSHVILYLVHPIAQPLDGSRGVHHPHLLCALTRSLDRRDVLSHPGHALAQLLQSLAFTL